MYQFDCETTDMSQSLFDDLRSLAANLKRLMRERFNRHVSFGDLVSDRWETAREYGFGEGSSCYNNVLILGDVSVGKNTWIGPNVVLDGSGGLKIGDFCTISAGVQIYTHDSVKWAVSLGQDEFESAPVRIGSGVYLGPQTVVQMGVSVGDKAVIGACSYVRNDIPPGARAWGCPAAIRGGKPDPRDS